MARPFEDFYIPEPNTGCWLWIGAHNDRGYGSWKHNGRNRGAHRWSLEWRRDAGGSVWRDCNTCNTPEVRRALAATRSSRPARKPYHPRRATERREPSV